MGIGWGGGLLVASFGEAGSGKGCSSSAEKKATGGKGCFVAAETAICSVAAASFGGRAVLLDDDVRTPGQMAFAQDFLYLHDWDVRVGFFYWFFQYGCFFALFTAAFLKLWLLVEVITRIAEERKTGSFELLLSSPLGVGGILRGIDCALIWQFGRSCCLLLAAGIVFYVVMDSRRDGILVFGNSFAGSFRNFFWPAAVVFFLDLWALKWIGVWSAMRCRTAARALSASFGAIFLLPWLLVGLASAAMGVLRAVYGFNWNSIIQSNSPDPVPWLWLAVFGGLAFGLGLWARDLVLHRFRLLAMHGFDYASAREEWLANASPSRS